MCAHCLEGMIKTRYVLGGYSWLSFERERSEAKGNQKIYIMQKMVSLNLFSLSFFFVFHYTLGNLFPCNIRFRVFRKDT